MIGRLRGILLEKKPPQLVIDVHGVGYEVDVPMSCFTALPAVGEEVMLYTHLVVREDAQQLYGFSHDKARQLFRELIKVSGIGAKMALAILSGMSASQFVSAVEQQNIGLLTKLPGIGKKTAERLVIEMRDRLKQKQAIWSPEMLVAEPMGSAHSEQHASDDAIAALVSLGYKNSEAERLIGQVANQHPLADSEQLIREALRFAL